ncbi:MAG: hypothetical protein PHO24_06775 [Clostridia bacterium]|nr:hypothetical protein [Clostridia bacterium]
MNIKTIGGCGRYRYAFNADDATTDTYYLKRRFIDAANIRAAPQRPDQYR